MRRHGKVDSHGHAIEGRMTSTDEIDWSKIGAKKKEKPTEAKCSSDEENCGDGNKKRSRSSCESVCPPFDTFKTGKDKARAGARHDARCSLFLTVCACASSTSRKCGDPWIRARNFDQLLVHSPIVKTHAISVVVQSREQGQLSHNSCRIIHTRSSVHNVHSQLIPVPNSEKKLYNTDHQHAHTILIIPAHTINPELILAEPCRPIICSRKTRFPWRGSGVSLPVSRTQSFSLS